MPLLGVSGSVWDGYLLDCGVLSMLLTSASAVSAQTLLPGQSSGAPLRKIPLFVLGIDDEPNEWVIDWGSANKGVIYQS